LAYRKKRTESDLDLLLTILPTKIKSMIDDPDSLVEIALDLDRCVELLYLGNRTVITDVVVDLKTLEHIISRVEEPGIDNRSGINGTLHRVSRIVNKKGAPVGLTIRVARPFAGNASLIKDLLEENKSLLLLGSPGTGKTTLLREVARILSSDLGKRVVVVDTSNEIGGEGNAPHPAIGRARRIQVPPTKAQHDVMIEAVENHNPQVIIIDEVSTVEESLAVQTIAKRGVQIIATAHGQVLEDLVLNKPLAGLVGGVKTVTLSDDEAKRRGSQKTVQERETVPPFDCAIEIHAFDELAVHHDIVKAADAILTKKIVKPELRRLLDGEPRVISPSSISESKFSKPRYHHDDDEDIFERMTFEKSRTRPSKPQRRSRGSR